MSNDPKHEIIPNLYDLCPLEAMMVMIVEMLSMCLITWFIAKQVELRKDLKLNYVDRLTTHNDNIPISQNTLTRFHSRAVPGYVYPYLFVILWAFECLLIRISLSDYLRRIVKYASIEKPCLLLLLIYIDRYRHYVKICSIIKYA